jgi:hypothetical protein
MPISASALPSKNSCAYQYSVILAVVPLGSGTTASKLTGITAPVDVFTPSLSVLPSALKSP